MTQDWKQFIQQFPISTPSSKILVDLSHFGVIKVSGLDAAKFLQGQLTCDVNALQPGEQTLGAYCNIKGKVDSLFRLWRLKDDYYLRMPEGLIEPTLTELQKYAIFSKVTLQNVSNQICGFGIANQQLNFEFATPELALLEITANHRYEIFGPIKALEKAWHYCINHANHVDPEVWEVLDIQAQLPELYPQTIGDFFPHDLNLATLNAVSFTKGCFRGQEIVARMQHRGKLKRGLYQFTSSDNGINPGAEITAGGPEQEAVAGTIVRACISNGGAMIGLAVITDSFKDSELYVGNARIKIGLP